MPRTRYAFSGHESVVDWNELAFRAHMDNLIQRYGHVTCVNLIDKIGKSATVRDQAQLGSAFGKYVKKYNQLSKLGDGTSSVGSSVASPMPLSASPASQALSASLSTMPGSSGSNGFSPLNGEYSAVGSPTSAATASSDKGSRPSSVLTLQTSASFSAKEYSPPQTNIPLAPTSISQLFAEPIAYVWFDFHHECRKMAWHNLSKLMTEVEEQFTQYRWFECDGEGRILSRQRGVFRVNCMDNLDRTNVVMSLFARRMVLMALQLYPFITENNNGNCVLDSPYKSFEVVFKNAWADNADYVSRMYAGYLILKQGMFRSIGRRYVCKPAFSTSGYIRRKSL
ncbi:unnamed protein product [Peronospora belbahrii]|uniref:SAC domain-containing protein n=1 Tax=Peronospora belbahrii TaxID=622444 RepID=A0AAU9L289_9STRA|nr:unnamed protein product [Peronospora belbahrii]